MKNEPIGLREVADLLGLQYYQIVYAIKARRVPDVKLRVGNRRLFDCEEVQHLAEHFGIPLADKEAHVK